MCVVHMYIYIYIYYILYIYIHIYKYTIAARVGGESIGWLRLVRSLKSYVSFAEYRLLYRALSQKRPIIFRSLLIVATP